MPTDIVTSNAETLNRWFDGRFAQKMAEYKSRKAPRLTVMVTRGTLDWAYPPFIIGSTAKALGWDVTMFFTFYGLGLLRKQLHLRLSALGNPAMPMKMPFGPPWLRDVQWHIPNLVMVLPGFERLATSLMRETLRQKGVASIEELRDICVETEVDLMACQMTVDLFGWKKDDFIEGIGEWAGAATFLTLAQEADLCLFT